MCLSRTIFPVFLKNVFGNVFVFRQQGLTLMEENNA